MAAQHAGRALQESGPLSDSYRRQRLFARMATDATVALKAELCAQQTPLVIVAPDR